MTTTSLTIDPAFKALIPPLSSDELSQLESNILRDGCREPLVLWNGVIIDGHNRFSICTKHSLSYQVNYMDLPDRESAEIWIIENQMGRRNLENIDKVPLLERKRVILEEQAKERQIRKPDDSVVVNLPPQNDKTRDTLAAEIGVSGKTYDALRTVSLEGTDELKQAVRDKKVGASTAAEIAHLPEETQREIAALATRKEIVAEVKKTRSPAPPEEWSAESKAAAAEAEKDSGKLWLLKSTWRTATKKDRALFLAWTPPACAPSPAKPAADDGLGIWLEVRDRLDCIPRNDPKKEQVMNAVRGYVRSKLGKAWRPQEGGVVAGDITERLELIEKDDVKLLDALHDTVAYCAERAVKTRFKEGNRSDRPDFARLLEHLCYKALALLTITNPRAQESLYTIKCECDRRLEEFPPMDFVGDTSTTEGGPAHE